jgi:hypothetical protein
MDFVEGGTVSDIETFVMIDADGTEEVRVKVEEAIHIKDEIPEATSLPPINTEHEVKFGVCVRWWQFMLLGHLLLQQRKCELHLTISCFVV